MRELVNETAEGWTIHRVEARPTVVVADSGDHAGLVLLAPDQPATVGSRFDHQGRSWEIRGRRPYSRVLVAEPVADGQRQA
jgi:hypothetical protein